MDASSSSLFPQESHYHHLYAPIELTLQHTFNQLDREKKGFVVKESLKCVMLCTNDAYDRSKIEAGIDECGQTISFQQFKSIFERASTKIKEGECEWLFKLYDCRRKGYIDEGDLRRASIVTGVELVEEEMDTMLGTQFRRVSLSQFKAIMMKTMHF